MSRRTSSPAWNTTSCRPRSRPCFLASCTSFSKQRTSPVTWSIRRAKSSPMDPSIARRCHGPSRALTPIHEEWRVAATQDQRRVVECKLNQRDQLIPVVCPVVDKSAEGLAEHPVHPLDFGGCVVVMWSPEDQTGAEGLMERSPKLHHESGVAVGHYTIWQPHVLEDRSHEVSSSHLGRAGLDCGDQHHPSSPEINVYLQKVQP